MARDHDGKLVLILVPSSGKLDTGGLITMTMMMMIMMRVMMMKNNTL